MAKTSTPLIGKFVLENLTVGMYKEPLCVYREYIQNSADAIDKAIQGQLTSCTNSNIYIIINKEAKTIMIEDNGIGVPKNKIFSVLQDIAASEKEVGKDKGFRGIGRLGGLGYCDELIFETSAKGESTKSVMRWNAKLLTELVRDRGKKQTAAQVIEEVTSVDDSIMEESDKHYFRVIMTGVRVEELLDVSKVKDYLKMVAPLPFNAGFIFRSKIKDSAKQNGITIDEYNVFLNEEQLYKGYTTMLYDEKGGQRTKFAEIKDVEFFKQADKNGKLLFWGWRSISTQQNVKLKEVNKSRGLRLRKHNIQIGDEYLLGKLFRDSRFNFHVVGEVYALPAALVPNGRRDDFEEGAVYADFKNKLMPICNDIQRLSYDASKIASAQKRLDNVAKVEEEIQQTLSKGVISDEQTQALQNRLQESKKKAAEAKKEIQKFEKSLIDNKDESLAKIFEVLVKPAAGEAAVELGIKSQAQEGVKIEDVLSAKPIFRSDKLSKLNKAERKLVGQIFEVINRVLPEALAENLIQKIEEKYR